MALCLMLYNKSKSQKSKGKLGCKPINYQSKENHERFNFNARVLLHHQCLFPARPINPNSSGSGSNQNERIIHTKPNPKTSKFYTLTLVFLFSFQFLHFSNCNIHACLLQNQTKLPKTCAYMVIIDTSCTSPYHTKDQINMKFGDAYDNVVGTILFSFVCNPSSILYLFFKKYFLRNTSQKFNLIMLVTTREYQ